MSNYEKNLSTMRPILNDELSLDHPPRGIRMERLMDGGTVIRIRMFSAAQVLPILFITLLWNSIVSIFVAIPVSMTAATFGYDFGISFQWNISPPPLWFLWLFLSPFIAIGLFLLLSLVFNVFGRCEIRLGTGEGSIFSGIGSIGRTRRFALQSIKSLRLEESKTRDKRGNPVTTHFNLLVEMNNGREIKSPDFGKVRGMWLVFALDKILGRTT